MSQLSTLNKLLAIYAVFSSILGDGVFSLSPVSTVMYNEYVGVAGVYVAYGKLLRWKFNAV